MLGRRVLLGLVLLAAIPACGGSGATGTVRPQAPVAERAVRTPRAAEPPPRLIAPPPAYGNKIVMAKSEQNLAVN